MPKIDLVDVLPPRSAIKVPLYVTPPFSWGKHGSAAASTNEQGIRAEGNLLTQSMKELYMLNLVRGILCDAV